MGTTKLRLERTTLRAAKISHQLPSKTQCVIFNTTTIEEPSAGVECYPQQRQQGKATSSQRKELYEEEIFSSSLFHCGVFCHLPSLRVGSVHNSNKNQKNVAVCILSNWFFVHSIQCLEKKIDV
jgi:hypothetical protein